jgi:hypothetical protein
MFNKVYRLFDRKTEQFYETKKGKSIFTSVGHIKSSLLQRYGYYKCGVGYVLPESFDKDRYYIYTYYVTYRSKETLTYAWN